MDSTEVVAELREMGTPATTEQIADHTGSDLDTIRSAINDAMEANHIIQEEDGYRLRTPEDR
jgi:predicted transcriptional regulator